MAKAMDNYLEVQDSNLGEKFHAVNGVC